MPKPRRIPDVFVREHFTLNRMGRADRRLRLIAVRNARSALQITSEIDRSRAITTGRPARSQRAIGAWPRRQLAASRLRLEGRACEHGPRPIRHREFGAGPARLAGSSDWSPQGEPRVGTKTDRTLACRPRAAGRVRPPAGCDHAADGGDGRRAVQPRGADHGGTGLERLPRPDLPARAGGGSRRPRDDRRLDDHGRLGGVLDPPRRPDLRVEPVLAASPRRLRRGSGQPDDARSLRRHVHLLPADPARDPQPAKAVRPFPRGDRRHDHGDLLPGLPPLFHPPHGVVDPGQSHRRSDRPRDGTGPGRGVPRPLGRIDSGRGHPFDPRRDAGSRATLRLHPVDRRAGPFDSRSSLEHRDSRRSVCRAVRHGGDAGPRSGTA